MPNRQTLNLFDDDTIFIEKLKTAQREKFANMTHYPDVDITYTNTLFKKTLAEDNFYEDDKNDAHLRFQHINNYKPITSEQRLKNKILSNDALKNGLKEIYN